MPNTAENAALERLRSPECIRERCRELLDLADAGALAHFRLQRERLGSAADYVLATIETRYPHLDIPFHSRWRHFHAGGRDRWRALEAALAGEDAASIARRRIDLAVTSVLLDAGAGDAWRYVEPASGETFARSEGLAIASFDMFAAGAFSNDADDRARADAAALTGLSAARLEAAFQVSADNPLAGVDGRVALLKGLGEALARDAERFGAAEPRPGNLYDYLAARADGGRLSARALFSAIVEGLAPIWPGRLRLGGANLGDVWQHSAIRRDDPSDRLVPFHKLSQWLAYSLVEPLEAAGLRIDGLDALTGLAEYRNGGLFVDLGVLACKDADAAVRRHAVDSELVVEWRALTVALLDELAQSLRSRLGLDTERLPLIKILEGGTWAAGRRVARERREGGASPVAILSDGTVF